MKFLLLAGCLGMEIAALCDCVSPSTFYPSVYGTSRGAEEAVDPRLGQNHYFSGKS